jgi:hypothetical protein
MTKLQWFAADIPLEAVTDLSFRNHHTMAIYEMEGGGGLVLTGQNLKADPGDPEVLGSGKVKQIVFKDAEGETSAILKGEYSAAKIGEAADGGGGGSDIFYEVFNGDDTIIGSKHAQSLWGGEGDDEIFAGVGKDIVFGQSGNDRLKGGKGSDDYLFADYLAEHDRDVILDLDIKGPGCRHAQLLWGQCRGYPVGQQEARHPAGTRHRCDGADQGRDEGAVLRLL